MGKGDKVRPRRVSEEEYSNSFDRIFYGKETNTTNTNEAQDSDNRPLHKPGPQRPADGPKGS